MAPSLGVESIADVPSVPKKKITSTVEVLAAKEKVRSDPLSSTVEVPLKKAVNFELEDHPVDIKHHLKVSLHFTILGS
jgi:hypothetical protein